MIKKLRDISYQIIAIIFYIFVITLLYSLFLPDNIKLTILEKNLAHILIELIALVLFIIIFRKKLIPDYYDFKKNFKNYIKKYVSYWLIGLVIMIVSNNIITQFIPLSTNEIENKNLFLTTPIYFFISVLIVAPITEELLTRNILKNTFNNPYIFYIISALLFGSLHLVQAKSVYELFYLIPYGTLGFVFAKMHYDSGNIWTNIFFHFFHNLLAVIILLVTTLGVII